MKRITYLTISFILFIYINACTGYEPIFSSTNLQLEIVDYSIKGNKKLGNKIYSQLHRLFKSNKNNSDAKTVYITIEIVEDINPTVKDSTGKILEYRVVISTNIMFKDFLTQDEIFNYEKSFSSSYKVQAKYSKTKDKENKIIDNLINKTYQDLLVKISEVALAK